MVFKVQDGIEFATRQEWRDYMMTTYYSFHDLKSGGPHVKPPGSIDGQMFDIMNCEGVQMIIMDNTEQVQVDNVKNCRIFLGASASTIFVRNCEDCVIFAACRQLRIRECVNCHFYSYSMGEIHIELSKNLKFGPFIGGYDEQTRHLQASGLLPLDNLWYSVYDHNAVKGSPPNWRLLKETEYEKPWFPAGSPCDVAIPVTPADPAVVTLSSGQVGESFSLEQMQRDAEAAAAALSGGGRSTSSSKKASPELVRIMEVDNDRKVNKLGIETALLVASARAKGIDVSVWLSESPEFAIVPAPDFNSRFISLGLAVGIQEDWETKRELDLATSAASLATILAVCGAGFNEEGVPLLNVHSFLCMCEDSVERYLRSHGESSGEASPPIIGDMSDSAASSPVDKISAEKGEDPPTPPSSPTEGVLQSDDDPTQEKAVAVVKPSPSGEPVLSSRGRSVGTGERPRGVRSNSEPAARRNRRSSATGTVTSSIQRFCVDNNESSNYSPHSAVENLIAQTVKQTDLYHKIQVHLGYIEPYTMTPARGKIVVSSPRKWISASEIKEAFCDARLHLSTPQIVLLINLIKEFASQTGKGGPSGRVSIADDKEMKSLNSALISSSVIMKHKIQADWLRKYLVHLRVGSGARPWAAWLDTKVKSNAFRKKTEDDMAIEFRKALGGLQHELDESEVEIMVKKFDILPPEQLQQVIKNKVDAWILDVDGRRDFTHMRNVLFKKWLKENQEMLVSLGSTKARKEEEKKAQVTIRSDMIAKKATSLRTSEKKNACITLELFKAYEGDNRKRGFCGCPKFGDWLDRRISDDAAHIRTFSTDITKRNREFSAKHSKLSWLGPINLIEYAINKTIQSSSVRIQHELRCKAIGLKKQVLDDNRAHRDENAPLLVTKRLFDTFFSDDFYRQLIVEAEKDLFFPTPELAEEASHAYDAEYAEKKEKQYREWIGRKMETKRDDEARKVRNYHIRNDIV
jgi:hypothetical protein